MSKFQNVDARTNTHNGPKSLYKEKQVASNANLKSNAQVSDKIVKKA
jgi:hypothetical protein